MPSQPKVTRISLGPLDHIAPSNIPQSIIYLSLKSGVSAEDVDHRLRGALRQTVSQLPWLAGRVYRQMQDTPGWRPGQLEIRCDSSRDPSSLMRVKQLDTTMSFADLRDSGFALETFDEDDLLWVSPFHADFDSGADVFAAQANFVPGGCLLALSIIPAASDGTAMLNVTKLWADHCSNPAMQAQEKPISAPSMQFSFHREVLDSIWEGCEYPAASTDKNSSIADLVGLGYAVDRMNGHSKDNVPPARTPSIFYMPQSAYSALRKQCIAEAGRADVSGNDLICAVIWRSVIRAWTGTRSEGNDPTTMPRMSTLAVPFDARPELASSLEAPFLGNMNFENSVLLPLTTLIADSTTVPWVARHIRTGAATRAHKINLVGAYNVLQSVPEYNMSHTQLRASRTLPESASVGILSPMVLPFNDTCFGKDIFGNDGKPESFRPLMGVGNRCYRTCFVVPRKQHGGIEFVMTLSERERDFLREDEEFGRYAFPLD